MDCIGGGVAGGDGFINSAPVLAFAKVLVMRAREWGIVCQSMSKVSLLSPFSPLECAVMVD